MSEATNVVDTEVAKEAFLADVPKATEELVTPVKNTEIGRAHV